MGTGISPLESSTVSVSVSAEPCTVILLKLASGTDCDNVPVEIDLDVSLGRIEDEAEAIGLSIVHAVATGVGARRDHRRIIDNDGEGFPGHSVIDRCPTPRRRRRLERSP